MTKPEIEQNPHANEVQEPVTVSVSDLLSQVGSGDLNAAGKSFAELIGGRVDDALQAEKIKVAGQIYNGAPADEDDIPESEVEAALAELDAEDADGSSDGEVSDEVEAELDAPETEEVSDGEAEEVAELDHEVEVEAVSDAGEPESFDFGSEDEHVDVEDPLESIGQDVDGILDQEDTEEVEV